MKYTILLIFTCLPFLSGCNDGSSSSLSLKAGAWEATSSFTSDLPNANAEIQQQWRSSHAGEAAPMTTRFCVVGSKEEKKLMNEIPSEPSCSWKIIKNNEHERLLSQDCPYGKDGHKASTYQFKFNDLEHYIESWSTEIEYKSNQQMTVTMTHKNEGQYLGADCLSFNAKSDIASMQQLSKVMKGR